MRSAPSPTAISNGERVICLCHGSSFDVRTGAALTPPAVEPLRIYGVRAAGGQIEVRLQGEKLGARPR
jgi:nitrite reductase/ring-hydroxylating ferredoxin subunit